MSSAVDLFGTNPKIIDGESIDHPFLVPLCLLRGFTDLLRHSFSSDCR